jgi:hypothetical protein
MLYSEASYFQGYAYAHIAAWEDHQRLHRLHCAARSHFVRNRRPARSFR